MNYLELFKLYTDIIEQSYINQMSDYQMDYELDKKYKEKEKILTEEIENLATRSDAFNIFTEAIEEEDPELFSVLIANLDSNFLEYDTLYDLYKEYNNIHKAKLVFPEEALKKLKL